MIFYNNLLCVERAELTDGIMPVGTYDYHINKGVVNVPARGLVEFDSLPEVYQKLLHEKYDGDVYTYMSKQPIRDLIRPDYKAKKFFDEYELPDGSPLAPEKRLHYSNDAAILNAFKALLSDKKKLKETLKITLSQFWNTAGTIVTDVKKQYPNTLPTSERRLKPAYNNYIQNGYESLIDKRLFNDTNNKKVDEAIERLILSLYVINKCYAKEAFIAFKSFMAGTELLFNKYTGEVFNPQDFYQDGKPVELSETTIWRIINKPANVPVIAKLRVSSLEYNSKHRPHMHRHAPVYSLSKISMDDISLPFKMADGKRVWAYQVFDVMSGCVIGKAFARSNDEGSGKDRGLLMAAVIDMFRTMTVNGWGTPMQIEVEQHISNTFAEDLLQAGNIFPFVRFCRGGNPQEKRAEGFINGKKYSLQHQRKGFQARPFARRESKRLNEDKNNVRYSFEEIQANELADINEWNNSEHPKFPGKTRWQVLAENVNPNIPAPDFAALSFYIGNRIETSIQRNQYLMVKGCKYQLPNVQVLDKLNDTSVTACYIPEADETIARVHVYQHEKFICTCEKLATYNEAMSERTADDKAIMHRQFAFRTSFDQYVKERVNELVPVETIANKPPQTTPKSTNKNTIKTTIINVETAENGPKDWAKMAFENL